MSRMPANGFYIEHRGLNIGQATATIALGSVIPAGAQIRHVGGVIRTAGAGTGTLTIKVQKRGTSVNLSGPIVVDGDGVAETDIGQAAGVQNTETSIPVALELDVVETGTVSGDVTIDLFIVVEA